jgi:hypothetical protein
MRGETLGRFGDARRQRVGDALLDAVQQHRTICLHRMAKDRDEYLRFDRFLANPAVSTHEMLVAAGRQTAARAAGRHILAVEDTTDLHFATQAVKKRGFGKAGNGEAPGLFLHPVLAVDADNGGIVGLLDCVVLNRTNGKVSDRLTRTPDEKESRRWLHGVEIAADLLTEAASLTAVMDREGDIYDLFARRPATAHLLCRSAQDRMLTDGVLLSQRCDSWAEQARETVTVPARPGQRERQATVSLRFGAIELKRPERPTIKGLPPSVPLNVVDVHEIKPPESVEPVHWRLITTHPVASVEQARQIVAWYRMRWTIEQVFRSLKTHGLGVEDSQIEDARSFTKMAVIALIAAVRSMQLVLARTDATNQPVTDAADPADMPALRKLNATLEGNTQALKNPYDDAKLAWFVWIVARLGGWSGYTSKGYRPPGPKTMHHGLLRLGPILQGWHLANRSADVRLP